MPVRLITLYAPLRMCLLRSAGFSTRWLLRLSTENIGWTRQGFCDRDFAGLFRESRAQHWDTKRMLVAVLWIHFSFYASFIPVSSLAGRQYFNPGRERVLVTSLPGTPVQIKMFPRLPSIRYCFIAGGVCFLASVEGYRTHHDVDVNRASGVYDVRNAKRDPATWDWSKMKAINSAIPESLLRRSRNQHLFSFLPRGPGFYGDGIYKNIAPWISRKHTEDKKCFIKQ